jgi:hypothetical protein
VVVSGVSLFDQIEPMLRDALCPAPARERLRASCAELPGASFLMFECHLGGRGRVDLIVTGPDATVLEYDLDGSAREPAVFRRVRPGEAVDPGALVAVLCDRGELTEASLRALHACADRLLPGMHITHLGTMRSRPGDPLRLNVEAPDLRSFVAYAAALQAGNELVDAVELLVAEIDGRTDSTVLALELGPRPQPRVGIECYRPSDAIGGWCGFVGYLEQRGLCTAAERHAILAWSEPAFMHANHAAAVREIGHLKLVTGPGEPLHAKAYLNAYDTGETVRPS